MFNCLKIVFPFILLLAFSPKPFAQTARIHASPIGEWQTKKHLPIEYHYNSVSVFLLNEDKLASLFDPANFTKEERKMTKVRISDAVESLYFYLQIPTPKNEKDSIFVPLYAVNIDKLSAFSSATHQGRVLDKITDEELDGKALNATARIEVVKKNRLLEVAYLLSKSLNRLIEHQIFGGSNILHTTRNAQQFFEKRYRGSIVSEFSVPIIPQNDNYEYELHSASLFQIKWDFQAPVKVSQNNVWADLKNWEVVAEENLRKKPTKIAKLKQHPYLLILRYKSSYALSERHRLVVELTPSYMEERSNNLYEFRKGDMKYNMEESFLLMLRDAMDLKRMSENYLHEKDKGNLDSKIMLEMTGQLYDLHLLSEKEMAKNNREEATKLYFEENYSGVYEKIFKAIDKDCFLERRIRELQVAVDKLLEMRALDINQFSQSATYDLIKTFDAVRQLCEKSKVENAFYFEMEETLKSLENRLYNLAFSKQTNSEKDRTEWLQFQKDKYGLCQICIEKADEEIASIKAVKREKLVQEFETLKSEQLYTRQCFSKIQTAALDSLAGQFPFPEELSEFDHQLYESYLNKVEGLKTIAIKYSSIEQVVAGELSFLELEKKLERYQKLIAEFCRNSCQLYHAGFMDAALLACLKKCHCNHPRP